MTTSCTVVIPTFNRADLLPATLDCALAQDHDRLEVLVLDDGSTDATPDLLRDYARCHRGRLRWERWDNQGQARSLNRGFEIIDSDLICLLSSDDWIAPETARILDDALADAPDAVVAYPDFDLIDEDGAVLDEVQSLDFDVVTAVRIHDCCIGPGAMVRRSVLAQAGGWNPEFRYCPDFDFWIRVAMHGRFVHVHQRLAGLRQHPGSLSQHRNDRMAEERVRLIRELYDRPGLPPALLAVREEAFRSAFITAALVCGGPPNSLGERYIVSDRLAPQILPSNRHDFHGEVVRQEAALRLFAEEMQRAQEALHEAYDQIRWLHQEVARRETLLAEAAARESR